jgi:hypothetical protein
MFVSPDRSSFLTGGYAGGAVGLRGMVRNSPAGVGGRLGGRFSLDARAGRCIVRGVRPTAFLSWGFTAGRGGY